MFCHERLVFMCRKNVVILVLSKMQYICNSYGDWQMALVVEIQAHYLHLQYMIVIIW